MPKGTVKAFETEKGFGTVVLETGEELPFDISASNIRDVKAGQVAEVTVGVGYKGQPKAKLLIFEVESDRAPSFATGLKQLQQHGFLSTWDAKQVKAAAREILDEVPSKLLREDAGALLQHYYGEGLSARGRTDGVITLDWRFGQVTQTPAEDLLALCPAGHDLTVPSVDLTQGLLPLVQALNDALAERGVGERFYSLDFEGDYYVIAYRGRDFADRVRELTVLKLG